ncbi:Exported zinc metalloprotease YfgC precursor [Methylophaga frappieri]|uniref:Putative beta-barrel assembly-enhancing protease n=1 Tax=Methylophaga frappieri (strain ATCC BAA-2434 / DSM 25690 / JAM7) TaxID=754477 RepID=I1YI20_METFJ|nr:M48 family metalloprotease [Methylophaga frappieri]AFJ02563.1 Exported zinc metalloprotease YfgC precursor [Methylophaga frappieri]
MKKHIISLILFLVIPGTQANLNIQLPEMGDSAGELVSPIEEYQVGQSFYWQLQRQVDFVADPEVQDYVRSLGYRLAAASDQPALPYTFFMVEDPSINAFAAPGGFVGVHSGLMMTAETEDEMASVIAHEIAHVTQRHILRGYEKSERLSVPLTAAMIAAALLGIADPSAGSAAMMAVQGGAVQMQLNYTRAHEAEADSLGMQTLVSAGFDPYAMPRFFERLQVAGRFYGGAHVPEFLRTHPITGSRIAETRARAEDYPSVSNQRDTKQFYLMREKLRVMTSDDLQATLEEYRKKRRENSDDHDQEVLQYGYARALLKANQTSEARKALMPLVEKDGDRLSYQLTLADLEIAVGNTSRALAIYQDNQRLYPDDRALTLEQVDLQLRTGQPSQAAKLLQRLIDIGENSQEVYRLLGKAHEQMGNRSQSHFWLAEAYYQSGQIAAAADQLRIAADHAKGDAYQQARINSRLKQVEDQLALMERQR